MSFNNIIGHKEVISFLMESVASGKISPVYIFTGPSSIGKKLVALNFAKLLNCLDKGTRPCDRCLSCRKIDSGNSPDIWQINPSGKGSAINIAIIRDIKRESGLKPFEAQYKIFIIDAADTLTQEASNSLLKVLEEAPPNNIFILITNRLQRILPTIISRSSLLRFRVDTIENISKLLCERHNITEGVAYFIAKFSQGRVGLAISMKDEDICAKKNKAIDKIQDFLSSDKTSSMEDGQWEYQERAVFKEDISYFLSWLRDIFVMKLGSYNKLIYNSDRSDEIIEVSSRISFDDLENLIDQLIRFESYVDANVNTKIIVDALICELVNLREQYVSV